MKDLKLNINTLELEIKNGDFVINNNLSEQNGGIILYTSNFNLYQPTIGVGIRQLINGKIIDYQNILNRWASQVKADGAKTASWSCSDTGEIEAKCNYE